MMRVDRAALVLVGIAMLNRRPPLPNAVLAGGILTGWGVSTLVEGIIDHQILAVHHARHGPDQLFYDIAFLVSGAVLVAAGVLVGRTAPAAVRKS